MFKKLRDKIKNWSKKVSEESEEVEKTKEKVSEEKESEKKEKEEIKKEDKKTKEKKTEKKTEKESEKKKEKEPPKNKKTKADKKAERERKREEKKSKKIKEKKESPKEAKEKSPVPELEKKESIQEVVEEIIKEPEEKHEKKGFFKKLTSKREISESDFENYSEDLEMILLENNVALEVTEKIIENLKEKIIGKEISKKELEEEIYNTLKETIKKILIEPYDVIEKIKNKSKSENKPYIILFCGVNGTGKTTSIAKFSKLLEKENISSVLAAGDTFRAASIEQLEEHGKRLNKKVIRGSYESDPASVGFDAIKYAEKNKIDCVLIDTAGRMHTAKNLMQEIGKVSRICQPDLKLFVGESTTGNDVLEQVRAFNETIGIDGIILSKADIDEKGGTALSVGYVTGKPILYLGTGQNYKDLEPFDKEKFIEKLGLNEE